MSHLIFLGASVSTFPSSMKVGRSIANSFQKVTNKVAEDFDGEERFLSINQLISDFRYASSSSQSGSIFGPEFKALESSAHVSMLVFFRRY